MEKISGILPSNSRLKSVDLKNSQPSRPGAPNFGQRMGTTAGDRLSLSEEAAGRVMQETLAGYNPKEARHAKIAEQMNRNFFDTRVGPQLRDGETTEVRTTSVDRIGRPVAVSSKERAEASAAESAIDFDAGDDFSSLDVYA